ncbi:MAG: hypothetical protein Q8N45_00875 [Anaerolineales bacterium]|nr:hypothetical protein [Anaerolineales bacterium]
MWLKVAGTGVVVVFLAILSLFSLPSDLVHAQQPTGSIPTVTGTPSGPVVRVYPDQKMIPVYAGPSSYNYPQIGVLLVGTEVPALGRSIDGQWIQIVYLGVPGGKGWVYAPLVALSPGFLPIIEPPPTATPRTTPTIDPTLAAAFSIPTTPTRLPTFTPPPPLVIPTFTPAGSGGGSVPMGLVIFGMAFIGVFVAIISFLRGR